jgi:hypothetical protein
MAVSDTFVFVHDADSNSHGLAKAHGDPVTFTHTVSVDPSAADHTPGALLFRFDSEPVADAAVTFTAIAMAESGGHQQDAGHGGTAVAMETLTIAHEGFWLI